MNDYNTDELVDKAVISYEKALRAELLVRNLKSIARADRKIALSRK